MKCPVDGTALVMTERSGVEIDYCPQCRGVWLDRGELDKVIDRASPAVELREPPRVREEPRREEPRYAERPRDYRGDDRGGYRDRDDDYRKKRKKGLLGEIFDF